MVSDARAGDNLPPFHANCRCTVQAHDPNFSFDPRVTERRLWESIAGNNLTFLQKCELLEKRYGDFSASDKKSLANDLAQLYSDDPEMVKAIEAFGNGVFSEKAIHPIAATNADGKPIEGTTYPDHRARDFGAPAGTSVGAAMPGRVVSVINNHANNYNIYPNLNHPNALGNYAVIESVVGGVAYHVYYAHLQQNSNPFSKGDYVTAGQIIGAVGNTGNSKGFHLHFEMRPVRADGTVNRNDRIDPYEILPDGTFPIR